MQLPTAQIGYTDSEMPKSYALIKDYSTIYPMIGLKVRGKLPGIAIFKEYWYGRRVDPLYYPYNPRTERQQHWRQYYAKGIQEWHSFDDETKRYYNKLIYPPKLSGINRFMRMYLRENSKYRL